MEEPGPINAAKGLSEETAGKEIQVALPSPFLLGPHCQYVLKGSPQLSHRLALEKVRTGANIL